jgi:hypothetical protein
MLKNVPIAKIGMLLVVVNVMEINYFTLSIILLLLLALVIWLVLRNRKDEKDFEQDNIDSSLLDPKDPDKNQRGEHL